MEKIKFTCPKCEKTVTALICPECDYNFAAAAIGRKGGQSTSNAKKRASRENGKKGGRPRKNK